MSSLTVSGLRPRDARFISFTRVLVVGQKFFLSSGWEGCPPPLKLWRTARRPVGFARPYSSREKRSPPRDPRGVVRETTPSNANKRRCRAGRVRLCPLPTFSGRFRYSGRVTASCVADEKRGGFGANEFARKPVALFLPAQSVISRSYFGFELRARADSHRA